MNRRNFISVCGKIGIGTGIMTFTACSLLDEKEMLLGNEEELKQRSFNLKTFNRNDILIRFKEGKWEVFNLTCRHKKCTVEYKTDEHIFLCPCHDGTYNDKGDVVSGPPKQPLLRYKTESRKGQLWVLNEYC